MRLDLQLRLTTPRWAPSKSRLTGLIDQGILSITRFGIVIFLARILNKEDFGVIALSITASYFVVKLQRALVALPFINYCSDREALKVSGPAWLLLSELISLACGIVFATMAAAFYAFNAPIWIIDALLILSVSTPCICIFEFLRRWFYQNKSYHIVLLQAILFCICSLVTLVFIFRRLPSLESAALTITIPYIVPGLISLYIFCPVSGNYRTSVELLSESWNFTKWTVADAMVHFVQDVGIQFWIAAVIGPSGSAAFGATRNLVAPVWTLISSIEVSEMPRLRADVEGKRLDASVAQTGAFLLTLGAPFLVALCIFSEKVLEFVYGLNYISYYGELRIWAAIGFFAVCVSPLEMWLLVSSHSNQVLRSRLAGSIVTLTVALALVHKLGVKGGIIAILCGSTVNLTAGAFFVQNMRRSTTRDV